MTEYTSQLSSSLLKTSPHRAPPNEIGAARSRDSFHRYVYSPHVCRTNFAYFSSDGGAVQIRLSKRINQVRQPQPPVAKTIYPTLHKEKLSIKNEAISCDAFVANGVIV